MENPQWWEKPRQPTGCKIHYMREEYNDTENTEATTSCLLLHHTLSRYYTLAWRNEGGPPGSCTKEQEINGEERELATCEQRYTGTRPFDTEDASGTPTQRDANV